MSAAKSTKRKCREARCRNTAAPGRLFCWRCRKRAERARNPVRAQFWRLRDKARARGIAFLLSMEQFCDFIFETGYLRMVGNERESMTIDRIDNLRGYEMGNIRPLSREENARKNALADERRMRTGYAKRERALRA